MQQIDYGYKESAIIEPEEDCFYKMNKAFENDASFKEISGSNSNMCVIHSRFAEVRRYYSGSTDIDSIPLEHAHPNIDHK